MDIHDHLLSTEERVADEFARAQRYGLLAICHGCVLIENGQNERWSIGKLHEPYYWVMRVISMSWCNSALNGCGRWIG